MAQSESRCGWGFVTLFFFLFILDTAHCLEGSSLDAGSKGSSQRERERRELPPDPVGKPEQCVILGWPVMGSGTPVRLMKADEAALSSARCSTFFRLQQWKTSADFSFPDENICTTPAGH